MHPFRNFMLYITFGLARTKKELVPDCVEKVLINFSVCWFHHQTTTASPIMLLLLSRFKAKSDSPSCSLPRWRLDLRGRATTPISDVPITVIITIVAQFNDIL